MLSLAAVTAGPRVQAAGAGEELTALQRREVAAVPSAREARSFAEAQLTSRFGARSFGELVAVRNGLREDLPAGPATFTFVFTVVGKRSDGRASSATMLLAVEHNAGSWRLAKMVEIDEAFRAKALGASSAPRAEDRSDPPAAVRRAPTMEGRPLPFPPGTPAKVSAKQLVGLYHGPGLYGWPCTVELLAGGSFVQEDPGLPGSTGRYLGQWALEGKTVVFYGRGQRMFESEIREGGLYTAGRFWKKVR